MCWTALLSVTNLWPSGPCLSSCIIESGMLRNDHRSRSGETQESAPVCVRSLLTVGPAQVREDHKGPCTLIPAASDLFV